MEPVSLVVLAAGRSTRFGRPKQLEPVGVDGETIMDLTMREAFGAGCEEARLVVHPTQEEVFRQRYRQDQRVRVLVQQHARGTAQATSLGMEHVAGTCIVVNGDDVYGAVSMKLAIAHAHEGKPEEHALVVFELGNTLSANGPVNRAVCRTKGDQMVDTEEVKGFVDAGDGRIVDEEKKVWDPTTLVSMNLWVFRPGFKQWLSHYCKPGDLLDNSEHGLPQAVRAAMMHGHAFRVLRTPDRWCGLTFPDDAELVRRFLAGRHEP